MLYHIEGFYSKKPPYDSYYDRFYFNLNKKTGWDIASFKGLDVKYKYRNYINNSSWIYI